MIDVPRTSFGAGTLCPPFRPKLPSCCVCPPKSIALTQPVASPLVSPLPLPICATLLNPDYMTVASIRPVVVIFLLTLPSGIVTAIDFPVIQRSVDNYFGTFSGSIRYQPTSASAAAWRSCIYFSLRRVLRRSCLLPKVVVRLKMLCSPCGAENPEAMRSGEKSRRRRAAERSESLPMFAMICGVTARSANLARYMRENGFQGIGAGGSGCGNESGSRDCARNSTGATSVMGNRSDRRFPNLSCAWALEAV